MAPKTKKEIEIDETPITPDTANAVEPNTITTQEQFSNQKYLDMINLNNELNSLNKGEITFEVIKKDNYVFDKTDKEGKPFLLFNGDGSPVIDEDGKQAVEQMKTPYVEIIGKGIAMTLSTKNINKDLISTLEQGKTYIGTYKLGEKIVDNKSYLNLNFIDVVSINDELMSRVNAMDNGL